MTTYTIIERLPDGRERTIARSASYDDAVVAAKACQWAVTIMQDERTSAKLPNGCDRQRAETALALYDARRRGGYANQVIAERANVKRVTGMGVRELRRWLADN